MRRAPLSSLFNFYKNARAVLRRDLLLYSDERPPFPAALERRTFARWLQSDRRQWSIPRLLLRPRKRSRRKHRWGADHGRGKAHGEQLRSAAGAANAIAAAFRQEAAPIKDILGRLADTAPDA
jgi:hypothetical protein